jgi:hypothetical protein
MTAHVEIDGKRIRVNWGGSGQEWKAQLAAMKTVPGRRFREASGDWSVPLDMATCRALRQAFDPYGLVIGPQLRSWAHRAKQQEETLGNLSSVMSARLEELPNLLPKLYRALYLGPLYKNATKQLGYDDQMIDYAASLFSAVTGVDYWNGLHGSYQTADVAFMANSPAPGNFNHQGLGKTPVTIGAVWEAGVAKGDHLVITPAAAVESVWGEELSYWQSDAPCSVEIFTCTGDRAKREATIEAFALSTAEVRWLVVNPAMLMWRKDPSNQARHLVEATPKSRPPKSACRCDAMKSAHWHYESSYPLLENHEWTTVTNDEAHQGGNVRNHRSLSARSINEVKSQRKHALTGTPMNAFGADIWGILHYLRPEAFTGFWKFAERYFEVDKDGFGWTVGKLRKEAEGDFFALLTQYALRRTKTEVLKHLPEKQHVDVWVRLEGKQAKAYEAMEANGFLVQDDARVSSKAVVDELIRLSQLARTVCRIEGGQLQPTLEGAKIEAMLQKLGETGVLDGTTDEQTIIVSESRKVIDLLFDHLNAMPALAGKVGLVTGANVKDRPQMVRDFQAGKLAVMCLVTTAGGVALTLDNADTMHCLDEPWTPGVQEQVEDRIHRGSRMHQVTIFHYRSRATVDEDRQEVAMDKDISQKYILDVRRRLRARREAAGS